MRENTELCEEKKDTEKHFGIRIRNHRRMTSPHKWLLCDQTIQVTLCFFEVIIFSLGLEAVTEAICHTGHLLDKVIYFRPVIGNLSCMPPPSPSQFHSFLRICSSHNSLLQIYVYVSHGGNPFLSFVTALSLCCKFNLTSKKSKSAKKSLIC